MTMTTEPRSPATSSARPLPMRNNDFKALAADVAAVCERYGVTTWPIDTRDRLQQALWAFIHPDLVGTSADPWHAADDNCDCDACTEDC